MMKFAFYISGRATRLCEILEDSRAKDFIPEIAFVISDNLNEEKTVRSLCEENRIEYIYYDYKNIHTNLTRGERNERLSDELLRNLTEKKVDYMFCFGHHLMSGRLLVEYENRIIVFHPSLLPSYTHFNAIDQAITNHEFVVGNTAFFADAGVDSGPIIMQSVMLSSNFGDGDYERLLHPIVDMFYKIWPALEEGRIKVDGRTVTIEKADYRTVNFYPEF